MNFFTPRPRRLMMLSSQQRVMRNSGGKNKLSFYIWLLGHCPSLISCSLFIIWLASIKHFCVSLHDRLHNWELTIEKLLNSLIRLKWFFFFTNIFFSFSDIWVILILLKFDDEQQSQISPNATWFSKFSFDIIWHDFQVFVLTTFYKYFIKIKIFEKQVLVNWRKH